MVGIRDTILNHDPEQVHNGKLSKQRKTLPRFLQQRRRPPNVQTICMQHSHSHTTSKSDET